MPKKTHYLVMPGPPKPDMPTVAYWCTLYEEDWTDRAGGMFTSRTDCLKFINQLLADEGLALNDEDADDYVGSAPLLFKGEQPNEKDTQNPIIPRRRPALSFMRGAWRCRSGSTEANCSFPRCDCYDEYPT